MFIFGKENNIILWALWMLNLATVVELILGYDYTRYTSDTPNIVSIVSTCNVLRTGCCKEALPLHGLYKCTHVCWDRPGIGCWGWMFHTCLQWCSCHYAYIINWFFLSTKPWNHYQHSKYNWHDNSWSHIIINTHICTHTFSIKSMTLSIHLKVVPQWQSLMAPQK